jgi:hypothetical protein
MSNHEDPEEYQEKVKKFATFGNLEGAKRAFVAGDYDAFENELKLSPYQYFRVSYNGSSDFDGSPDFVVKNFVTGLITELQEKYSKYFFNVYRCFQPSSDVKSFRFDSLWIVNTPELADLYGGRMADFTWQQIDSSNESDFSQFLADFRKLPEPVVEIPYYPPVVYEAEDDYDPFSFGGGYDDEEEAVDDKTTNLESDKVSNTETAKEDNLQEVPEVNISAPNENVSNNPTTDSAVESVAIQLDQIQVEVKTNVLISQQYLH